MLGRKSVKFALFLLVLSVFVLPSAVSWWNSDWQYRTQVNVTENSGQDLENFTVKIETDTSNLVSDGKLQTSCQDIRFTGTEDQQLIDHWIESGCGTSETVIWVEIPMLNASEDEQIFMYYGNPEASQGSDGGNTFQVFDGFEDGTVSSQWTDLNSGDSVSESGGRLEVTKGNIYSSSKVVKQPGTIVEARLKYTSSIDGDHSGLMIADSGSMSGSNSNSNTNVLFITDDSSNTISMWSGDGQTTSYNICSGLSVFTANVGEDYIYGIEDTGSEVRTTLDYSEGRSCSGDLTSTYSDFVIGLGHFNLDSDPDTTSVSYDWVRTRQSLDNRPSVTVGATEEGDICDRRGIKGECIVNSSKDIGNQEISIESVFESEVTASFSSDSAVLNISNTSFISGIWRGGLELSANRLVLRSGASFDPEGKTILLKTTG